MATKDESEVSKQTSRISLSITGTNLDLGEISRTLGAIPTKAQKGGTNVEGTDRNLDEWILTSPLDQSEAPDIHLRWFAKFLEPHHRWLLSLYQVATVTMQCNISARSDQCGFEITPEVLGTLVELRIRLTGAVSLEDSGI